MSNEPEQVVESRRLILDDEPRLGQAITPDAFRMHWEFWLQISTIYEGQHHRSLHNTVSADDAFALAELLCGTIGEESWQIQLYLWGDDDGDAVRQLIAFLGGGGFSVLRS